MQTPVNPARAAGQFFKTGDWARAWKLYSFREMDFWGANGRIIPGVERWSGQPLKGKTLLLTYEQALGEQLLFSSMVAELADMAEKVIIEVDPRLVDLFARSFKFATVVPFTVPWNPAVYEADYHCLLGRPSIDLRKCPEDFPKVNLGYIKPPIMPWGNDLPDKRVVGISWYSSAIYAGQSKSLPLSAFEPLLNDSRLIKLDLQYGCPPETKDDRILATHNIEKTQDIDGLAFLISQCSSVVTISNLVAHLAGAMGKEVFLLLKQGPARHWYWDMPYYPNVKRIELEEGKEIDKITEIYKILIDKL